MIEISKNQIVPLNNTYDVAISLKREDLLHPAISGNKYRKLKYNILEAKKLGKDTLLTFGGAFSNHIAATAAAGAKFGFKTIGIIRGEELESKINENTTLTYARQCGMVFKFISRAIYKTKNSPDYLKLLEKEYPSSYILPEGGTNDLAIKGCEEILHKNDHIFDYICVPVGTGGTIAGLINGATSKQQIIGFSALKGDFLVDVVSELCNGKSNWQINADYHFGGYGKINAELITFINEFRLKTKVLLDPIYTGKMMYGVLNLLEKGFFKKGSKILVIHTGGLQGIKGINNKLQGKGLPLINDNNEEF